MKKLWTKLTDRLSALTVENRGIKHSSTARAATALPVQPAKPTYAPNAGTK
jgi:hypothetical protein